MPSPFPGMDPYLEEPDTWPEVHLNLITELQGVLVPQLAHRYRVSAGTRVCVVGADDAAARAILPDLFVRTSPSRKEGPPRGESGEGVRLLMVPETYEFKEYYLVVRSLSDRKVVTVIELLSPSNKTRGSHLRDEYLRKRDEVLASTAHFLEVDLLRDGLRFPSVSRLPKGDYSAHVSRVSERPHGRVWTWGVRDPLPTLPVPLLPGDPDAKLPLGEALTAVYDRLRYDLEIDYRRPPAPPLRQADAEWATSLPRRRRRAR